MKAIKTTVHHTRTFPNEAERLRFTNPTRTDNGLLTENVIKCYGLEDTSPCTLEWTTTENLPPSPSEICCHAFMKGLALSEEMLQHACGKVRALVQKGLEIRAERHRGHSELVNDDGTVTVSNDRLTVTLPTEEFERIGRYGVFNNAMRMLGNRSEARLLHTEPIDPTEILDFARENLVHEYLQEHCRYNLGETLMRMNNGYRMSSGMAEDVSKAQAYANGILNPISQEDLLAWVSSYFKENLCDTPQQEREYRRQVALLELKRGNGYPAEAASALAAAAESLQQLRDNELEYRTAIGGTCKGWKIDITGPMPDQIGLCRYQEAA